MIFVPRSRTGDFQTIGYFDLQQRLEREGRLSEVDRGIKAGELIAYVQAAGDPLFYRIPKEFWNQPGAFMEGVPNEELFCWGMSSVEVRFQHKPLLFFLDEVEIWHSDIGPRHDLEKDYDPDAFMDCYERASASSEVYWSAFVTIAWVLFREEKFACAAEIFEGEQRANKGGAFTELAWWNLDKIARDNSKSCKDAEQELRLALEAGLIVGIATSVENGLADLVPAHRWTQWRRQGGNDGLEILPGLRDFKWASKDVRKAFPPAEEGKLTDAEKHATRTNAPLYSGNWINRRPSDQAKLVYKFFALARPYLVGGSDPKNPTEIRKTYVSWLKKNYPKATPYVRSAFEDHLARYEDGWRIRKDGSGMEHLPEWGSPPMPDLSLKSLF